MTTDDRILSGASSESSLHPNKSSGDIGELKPCPWCGSTASRVRIMSRDAIQCDGENCGVIKRTPDEWNTRTPDPESAAEIERLRRELGDWKQAASVEAGLRREFLKRAETAESAVADAMEALKPFEEAYEAVCYDDGVPDDFNIWESPAAMSITVGDLRRASAIRAAVSKKTAESGHSPSTHNSESE